jgi:hypothetical protein
MLYKFKDIEYFKVISLFSTIWYKKNGKESQPDKSCVISTEEDGSKGLNKRGRYLQKLLTQFWSRWKKGYLTELREHDRHKNGISRPTAKEGDIVSIIHQHKNPRQSCRVVQEDNYVHIPAYTTRRIPAYTTRRKLDPINKIFA